MAIYHLEGKIISRGLGRTACGAAAYMSCSHIYNEYDGMDHDYTHKRGLVWEHVFLPPNAPKEWTDRQALWNAVETVEKTKDSQLAREFITALPIELNQEQRIVLLSGFIENELAADGMCADAAIHDTDGHNPHAHILLTMRPLDENGKWQYKSEKEYLCVQNGVERGFTSAEFKIAEKDGWEKQYQYLVGDKKVYRPPSKAEGLERVSKYPKSTKFGRKNPITERWNSEAQFAKWRESWAEYVNRALEHAGIDERIDHRSNADRGLDEKPTIHEGVTTRKIEKAGFVSERCEINRRIREDNALIRTLKALVQKLKSAIENTVSAIASAMETVRQNIIVLHYGLTHIRDRKRRTGEYLKKTSADFSRFNEVQSQIKEKETEREGLQTELNRLSLLNLKRRREIKTRLTSLYEELEELRFEESALIKAFGKTDAREMKQVKTVITNTERELEALARNEQTLSDAISKEHTSFDLLKEKAADLDPDELADTRLTIRPQMEAQAQARITSALKTDNVDIWSFYESKRFADTLLNETDLPIRHRKKESRREEPEIISKHDPGKAPVKSIKPLEKER